MAMERQFDMGEMFERGRYADVTISYSGRELKLHKAVLCMRSKYFEGAFGDEGQFVENTTGVIELHDDDPQALEKMLRYLYTSEYERAGSMDGTMDREVCHEHLSVAAVADKYGITTLTEDALDKLRIDSCFLHGEEVSEIVLEAMEKIRSPDSLKEYILRMLELRFADCMQCGVLREWVEKQPGLEERLVRQNIVKAMKDQGFRTELAKDGERAVRYLQYQTQCLDTESWGSPRSPSP